MKIDMSAIVDELRRDHYEDVDPDNTDAGPLHSWQGLNLTKLERHFQTDAETILRAMRKVAKTTSLRHGEKRCTSCGMPMHFRGRTPYDRTGLNHFINCPNRAAHRKGEK